MRRLTHDRPWLCNICLHFDFKRSTTFLFQISWFFFSKSIPIRFKDIWFIVIVLLFSSMLNTITIEEGRRRVNHGRFRELVVHFGMIGFFFFPPSSTQSWSVVCGFVDVATWQLIAPTRHIFQVGLLQWLHPVSRSLTKLLILHFEKGWPTRIFSRWCAWHTGWNVSLVRLETAWWWKIGLGLARNR